MKVVVTGGAGFIGANLCRRLTQDPGVSEIVAFDDLSTGSASNLDGIAGVELQVASILEPDALANAVDNAGVIVHLAARPSVPRSIADPVATHRVNVDGTLNVLEACRAQPTRPVIVFASSSSVYGSNPELPKHERMATWPRSPYAASKLAGEACVLGWAQSFAMPSLAFRFFNVYGPLQQPGHAYAAVIPAFLSAALLDQPLPVDGDGTQSRDFTFVGTVADVITRAVTGPVTHPSPVNLAFGTRITLNELIAEMERMFGAPLPVEHRATRAGDVSHSQADNTLLRSLFPDVAPVPLADGLRQTYDWMKSLIG